MLHSHNPCAIIATTISTLCCASAMAGGLLALEFSEASFSDALTIDNPYWPLYPDGSARTFTYVGETEDECVIDRLFVDGTTYELTGGDYAGFTALEVVDVEWVFEDVDDCDPAALLPDDSAVKEATRDWYAQDDRDNIWYLGELSRVYGDDDGVDCGDFGAIGLPTEIGEPEECFEGSWEAGLAGGEGDEAVIGEAGIVVPGDEPVSGRPLTPGTFYLQEVAYEAEDMAKILRMNATLAVEDSELEGDYAGCRKVKEWTALDPGASVEHKWYCPGPGLLLVEGIGGGPTELETLVEVEPPLPDPGG